MSQIQRPGLRERKNARTREAIERAALELALEQGFDRTTVDQIAERADVSPRTVFVRYPTKEDIVFGREASERAELKLALEHGGGDIVDRLEQFVRLRAEAEGPTPPEAEGPTPLQVLRRRAIRGDPYLRRVLRGYLDASEELIGRRLADELGLPADDPGIRVFTAGVSGLWLAMIDAVLDHPEAPDPLARCEPAHDVLRAGLATLQTRAARRKRSRRGTAHTRT